MKTIYFVRHGESEANVGHPTFLGEKSDLTPKGREQARFIAERCKNLSFDALISSTAERARMTAEYISQVTGKNVEVEKVFTERKLPTSIIGQPKNDKTQRLHDNWQQSFFDSNIRIEDGENFTDLKGRALQALAYLLERPEKTILVATHGFFLHMIVALVTLGDSLTAEEFNRVAPAVWMDNTGITRIEHREQVFTRIDGKRHTGWVLRVWNDHAHLG